MLVLASLLCTAQAFGPISRLTFGPSLVTNQLAVRSFPSRRIACAPSMNQDEIAELEAKLAEAKADLDPPRERRLLFTPAGLGHCPREAQ